MLYSKEQNQNAEELARSIRNVTGKDVSVFSLENAMRLVPDFETERLYFLFKEAGRTLFGEGGSLFAGFKFTLFNYQNYTQYCQNVIEDELLQAAIQGNLNPDKEGWSIFINYLSHTEPIFLVLVNRGIFKPDAEVGVYSILNPCNSCKWLFDTSTKLQCNNCFMEANADRIFFYYLGIDGQHRKKKESDWMGWHIWRPTAYDRGYKYGDNDIEDKPK